MFDVEFRRLLRQVVGPLPNTDWTASWHEILHAWNERVDKFTLEAGIRTWSTQCINQYWSFTEYVRFLPAGRFVRRVINWKPDGTMRPGMQGYI